MNLSKWKTVNPGKELEDIIYDISNEIVRELGLELDITMKVTLEFSGSTEMDCAHELIQMILNAKGFKLADVESDTNKMTISFE